MRITSEKRLSKLKTIDASEERPFLVCKTCGLATDKVIKRFPVHNRLKRKFNGHRRAERPQKRWSRLVKYSEIRKRNYHNKEVRQKEILFSYIMMACIEKRHKISVRRKPFSRKLVTAIK